MPQPFLVSASDVRVAEPLDIAGDIVSIKVAGKDTDGRYTVMTGWTPPQGGPPLHVHLTDAETFYVLEGTFMFELDGVAHIAETGATVQIPAGVPHLYQNVGDTPGRTVLIVEPAGLDDFFIEFAVLLKTPGGPPMDQVAALHSKFKMELLGPPAASRG